MRTVEPFNLGKRLEQLHQQASYRQFASYQTSKEIAFHLKDSPLAPVFAPVVSAIEAMDFPAAVEALEPVRRSVAEAGQ